MILVCKECGEELSARTRVGLCRKHYFKWYRENNKDKIKAYNERTKEHRKKRQEDYYDKNCESMKIKDREWKQKNTDRTSNTPEKKRDSLIRSKTRHKYPLDGNKCEFCNSKAEERHHTTDPIEIDKFVFVCTRHHKKEHGKRYRFAEKGEEE